MAVTGNVLVIGDGALAAVVTDGVRAAGHTTKLVAADVGVEATWISAPDLIVLLGEAARDGGLRMRDELCAEPASAAIPLLVVYAGPARPAKDHPHVSNVTPALGAERLVRVVALLAAEIAEGSELRASALQTLTSGIQHQVERQAAFSPPGASGAHLPPPPAPVAYNSPSPLPFPTPVRSGAGSGIGAPPGMGGALGAMSARGPGGRRGSIGAGGAQAPAHGGVGAAMLAELPYHDAQHDGPAPLAPVVALPVSSLDRRSSDAALESDWSDDAQALARERGRQRIRPWPARAFGITAMLVAAVMILYALRIQARHPDRLGERTPVGSLRRGVPR